MARHVTDRDLGWKKIKQELEVASRLEVAVGLLQGDKNGDGVQIAEYAAYNEFGTDTIPSRPFMRTAFDENRGDIQADIDRQSARRKKGSEKTLVDTSAMINAVKISVRSKT